MHYQAISLVTILVDDYDRAIDFYTQKLGFVLLEDTVLSPEKRWVRVAATPDAAFALLLAKAATEEQIHSVGHQSGGRVFLFLQTAQFWFDYYELCRRDIVFIREPQLESYGWVAVFEDLYGNKWDLIGPENSLPAAP